ncbi:MULTISPECIES: dephospho-CoA kinase [unclassified Rickettsia]|uniref:dephospho-CoA kinase n=1 Tax=unclassified Rickettsia TaxID=114295 RepID=UPI00209CA84B|nr:dephospho-CoA kinase [Rickettsia endosymbiont of Ceutorhynchus assimilis]
MLAIGITGSYASGKTFVVDYLASKGYKTFSADECVKNLYKNIEIQNQILNLLPSLKIFDRTEISTLIYNDDKARQKLQDFIYPLLIKELIFFKQQNKIAEFIFAEIPLLFEANFKIYFDFVVTIFCSEETRIKRAIGRPSFDPQIYKKIEKIQLSQEDKITRADFAINSDCDMLKLEKQIMQLIKKLECHK